MEKHTSLNPITKKQVKIPISMIIGILLILTAVLYIPVFKNILTNWDDELYIFNNPYLKSLSFENLKRIFTVFYLGNYHPLTLVSLAIDYKLGGLQPWHYQLTNLILHLCNALLVYAFVKLLIQYNNSGFRKYNIIPLVTAVLFGIHPFQVESVAWLSERKNVLYAFFFLASLVLYIKYLNHKSYRAYILSILLFILSLLSKGMAVPLSLCILCIDYFIARRLLSKKVILEKIPYFTLSLIFGYIAILAQHSSNSIRGENNFEWFERIAVASYGFIQYLLKLCFPYQLSAFYPYPVKPGILLPYQFYAYIALACIFLFIIWKYLRHNKTVLFGTLFFIANISIVIQFLPVGDAIMADRYAYIASIGFFFIVGYCCNILWQKNKIYRNAVLLFLILYCSVLGVKTYHRVGAWKDSFTLWNDALKNYPDNNDRGFQNRGNIYFERGLYKEALQDYNRLIQIDPRNSAAYIGLGRIKQVMKDMQGAMDDFNTALSLCQTYEGYIDRAALKLEQNDFGGALLDLDQAIQLNPYRTGARLNKGILFYRIGNYTLALQNFDEELQLDPASSKAYLFRAIVKIQLEDYPGAISDLNMSIQSVPTADAFYNRGIAYIRSGNKPEGCKDLNQSLLMGNIDAQAGIQQYCK